MTNAMRRGLEAALGGLGLLLAVGWLSGGCEERVAPGRVEAPGAAVAEAGLAAVEEVALQAVEWATGEVASARHTAIASRVLARIEEVRVRAGSAVAAGDVLVVLDARDLRARLGEAEEALRSGEARLELAQREHARTRELVASGVAPQRRLDEATSQLRAARADVAGRREALEEARAAASFAELRSPAAGRVVDRLAEPGDTAVPGRPLLRIYDPALLRVEAPVRESLAVRLRVGDPLRVEVPALGAAVDGRIDEIVPFAERGARTLLVKVALPRSDERLFAGMFARVAIPAGERRLLRVPEAAIERVGQLEFVTVAAPGGAAERRLVTTGERVQAGFVEVLSGLRAGERVQVAEAPAEAEAGAVEAPPPAAAAAVAALRDALGAALREALARGPEAALDACRDAAPRLAAEAARPGVRVGRTSHRLRNPANAPEAWLLPWLEAYRRGESQRPFQTVDLGAEGTGYVEPIHLAPLCATCHGENVDAALLEAIRARYPDDEAVGFRVGELRGLFWAIEAPAHDSGEG
jgi:RND family efflux transporter MFP subunit